VANPPIAPLFDPISPVIVDAPVFEIAPLQANIEKFSAVPRSITCPIVT
jgi:hypothetical protein